MKKKWERWEKIAFGCFGLWWLAGSVFLALGLDASVVETWKMNPWLKSFVLACFGWGDFLLMALAAINTYAVSRRAWGERAARFWTGWCVIVGAIVETIGTMSDFPFGAYGYTGKMGPRIAGVLPLAIPLAWFSVIGLFLFVSWQLWRNVKWLTRAVIVASLTTVFDYLMEPFAVHVKGYWVWGAVEVPPQNYVSWWVVTFLLVCFAAPRLEPEKLKDVRPPLILTAMLFLFIVGRMVYGEPA